MQSARIDFERRNRSAIVMTLDEQEWRPGSFTKNFGWGDHAEGMSQLRTSIKHGFAGLMEDVPREVFRMRLKKASQIDYIPMNFFLFNKRQNGVDYLIADELVFQALSFNPSPIFDKLALFAFNFSYAGKWNGAREYQRRPALWAFHYIRDRVAGTLNWDTSDVDADDIQAFVSIDRRYTGGGSRKLATNLSYLYSLGRLRDFSKQGVEAWWADALFLALDRLIEDRSLDGLRTMREQYGTLLSASGFHAISGRRGLEKDLATSHLVALYAACGSRDRFSEEHVKEWSKQIFPDQEPCPPNDPRPQGAVHPTNPHILKTVPRACAPLAQHAGFQLINADELAEFHLEAFVEDQVSKALITLKEQNVVPAMTAQELMDITREK